MWLDRVVKWLLPREEHFFDLLERGAECARLAGALLRACCREPSLEKRLELVERMRHLEREADKVIAEVHEALNKTFVTPMDRTDIYDLANDLEGLSDDIFATLLQLEMHNVVELPAGSAELADQISEACELAASAVGLLRSMKNIDRIREVCNSIRRLEDEGDNIFRSRIAALFREERDAVRLIQNKEFLEGLEDTLDLCDDVGNVLEGIVLKNA